MYIYITIQVLRALPPKSPTPPAEGPMARCLGPIPGPGPPRRATSDFEPRYP